MRISTPTSCCLSLSRPLSIVVFSSFSFPLSSILSVSAFNGVLAGEDDGFLDMELLDVVELFGPVLVSFSLSFLKYQYACVILIEFSHFAAFPTGADWAYND